MNPSFWIAIGAVLGGLGVAAGAFGAHGLQGERLQQQLGWDSPELVAKQLDTFEIAVRYQMYHAPAILLAGILLLQRPSGWATAAAWCFLLGVLIFCGLLYGIVFTKIRILGAIVPIGGVLLIVGWALLAVAGLKAAGK